MADVFVDAEKVLKEWAAGITALVGAGQPLNSGLHLSHRDSPGHATAGVVTLVDDGEDLGGTHSTPTLSIAVSGPTKEAAEAGSRALANQLRGIRNNTPIPAAAARILWVANVTRLWAPDGPRPRYVVRADLAIAPA